MGSTVAKIFGIGGDKPDTSASDAAIAAANQAASLNRSKAEADRATAEERSALTIGAPGKRGLLAFASPDRRLSDTLG